MIAMKHFLAACFFAAFLAAFLASGPGRAEAPVSACAVPPELLSGAVGFPALAKRFKSGHPVTIVAVGGASTADTAAGADPANAYPQQLEKALQRHHPQTPITVLNKGVPRQTAREMLARFAADVLAPKPQLVIWETGTVDAVRDLDIDDFAAVLKQGIDEIRAHHAEVMLVDMQFNSQTSSIINFKPYLDVLRRIAGQEDVYLFRRHDIMRFWSDAGRFNVAAEKQTALAQEVYRCLGNAMAEAIDRATR
jgi:GDSL-like Lipase/Acylhydrolase family